MRFSFLTQVCCAAGFVVFVSAAARAQPTFTEFPTATATANVTAPTSIVAGPDGNVWFLGTSKVGRINATTGVVTEFSAGATPVATLGTITVGPDHALWFTKPSVNIVARLDPATGNVTEFPVLPGGTPTGIAAAGDKLWVTESVGNRVVRLTVDLNATPPTLTASDGFSTGLSANSQPGDIQLGPDGNLWFAQGNRASIAKVTQAGVITELPLPDSAARANKLATNGDSIWYTDLARSRLVRIVAATGAITETPIPGNSQPNGIALGSDGNVWFTEQSGERIGRFFKSEQKIEEYSTGLSANPGLAGIATGPDGNIWFAETSTNKIGKTQDASFVMSRVQFGSNTFNVNENAGTVAVTVTRLNNLGAPASVTLTTSDGTARAGEDYVSLSKSVDFLPGQASKTVDISVIATPPTAPAFETVNLTLSSPIAATLGTPATATVSIFNTTAPPTAGNDSATAAGAVAVEIDVLANDTTSPGATLDAASIDLDPGTAGQQASFTDPGKGTFSVVTTASGTRVSFTAAPGFTGNANASTAATGSYTVADNFGGVSGAGTISVDVTAPASGPTANADSASGRRGQSVRLQPSSNDAAAAGALIAPTTIDLDPATNGQQTTLATADGNWALNTSTGEVTFTPASSSVTSSSASYTIQDNYGQTSAPANIQLTLRKSGGGGGCAVNPRAPLDWAWVVLLAGLGLWRYRSSIRGS